MKPARWSPGLFAILFGIGGGILASAVVSFAFWSSLIAPEFARLEGLIANASSTGTQPEPPEPEVEIIPLESRPLSSSLPAIFTERQSAAFPLVRRSSRTSDQPVTDDRLLGSAVAITSDGWLVTSDSAVGSLRLADLSVAIDGIARPVERAVRDRSTDLVYLKVSAFGLTVPGFVRALDVTSGSAVWVEAERRAFRPEAILSVRAHERDAVSSERAGRRYMVSGEASTHAAGAPVWDGGGRLIALLDGFDEEAGAWRALPAGNAGRDLASLLSNGEIRRASLGVRALEIDGLLFDAARAFPKSGAWLRAERRTGLPAIVPAGPAAGILRDGDVIERIERDILDGTADLGERLLEYRPGAEVTLIGRRGNDALSAQVTLGSTVASEEIK